jgi:integrase
VFDGEIEVGGKHYHRGDAIVATHGDRLGEITVLADSDLVPLRPSHVWSIRTKLQIEGKKRDLARSNLAIDNKLRDCDVVAVRVDDVAPSGYAMDRATIRQKKTGRPVRFELTDQTRQAIDEYLRLTGRKPGQFLFAGRGDRGD